MGEVDLIDWPEERTLVVAGPPAALKIPFSLRNRSLEPIRLHEASLADMRLAGGGASLRLAPVPLGIHLPGEGASSGQMRLRLDPTTPPGRYEGRIRLGDVSRAVTIDVLPEPRLQVRPEPVVVDASTGREQRFRAAFANTGNMPLTIDLTGDYPLGEEAQVAAGRLDAVGEGNRVGQVLDRIFDRETRPALVPFDAARLVMPGGRERLEPGESRTVEIGLTLPEGLSPTARYHLFAPSMPPTFTS